MAVAAVEWFGDIARAGAPPRATARERVGRRNRREYIAAAFVVIAFGSAILVIPSIALRIAGALMVAATVFVVRGLHVRGSVEPLPADLAGRSALDFHRAQLVRQRDLLKSVWTWYLMPFVPGVVVFLIGLAQASRSWTARAIRTTS